MQILTQLVRRLFVHGHSARAERGVVVFRQDKCVCSDEAIARFRERGIDPVVEQLEDHPEVRREYGAATPIVSIDGRIRFFGKVDPVLLDRLLSKRPAGDND
ncbi:MAG: hypothetical protein AAGB00_06395 [Planctomycetota bacterium]